jgi:hyperosmotically inducible periplasmic protein
MKKHLMIVMALIFSGAFVTPKAKAEESAGQYIDDSVITTKIRSLLAVDDFLESFQISVETYKGSVQLAGFVDSQRAIDKAGEIAGSVNGVHSVKNNLEAKAGESVGEYVDDSFITSKVKSLLAGDDFLKSFHISVETNGNVVQMSGFVDSQTAVDKAVQIARSVKGVYSVKNSLIVK